LNYPKQRDSVVEAGVVLRSQIGFAPDRVKWHLLAMVGSLLIASGATMTAAAGIDSGAAVPVVDTAGPMSSEQHEKRLAQIRDSVATAEKRRKALLAPEVIDPAVSKALAERWGVEVYGVRQATGGMMIDFRFRVLDAEKATHLFESQNKPYLVKEGTDVKLPVPMGAKVGAFRPTNRGKNITSNKDYYMMFANPGSYVKPGEKVSVVIGDFRVEKLTVRQ
jgi:hypothetical protein